MKNLSLAYIFTIVAITGLLLSNLQIVKFTRNKLQSILLPSSFFINKASNRTVAFLELWQKVTRLEQDNQRLTQENLQIKAKLDQLKELEQENLQLRGLLNIAPPATSGQTIIARVVGLSPYGFFQTLTIDRGQKDGVEKGKPVISSGFLVGSIAEVSDKTATVRLISAHNSLIPVLLANSRVKGLLKGGVKGIVVEDIPVDVQIQTGEPVVTAGLTNQIPAGISVGQVEEVISTKGEIFQVAKVKLPINFTQLEVVAVIK